METLKSYIPRGGFLPKIRFPSFSQLRDGTYFQQNQQNETNQQNWAIREFESKLVAAQELAIWTSPIKSIIWLLLTQFLLYWLLSGTITMVSSIAYSCLATYVYITWVYTVWPAIRVPPENPEDDETWTPVHPDVLSAPEMSVFLSDSGAKFTEILSGLSLLRKDQPLKFCFLMSLIFGSATVFGTRISTTVVIHLVLFIVLVLPALLLRLSRNEVASPVLGFIKDFLATLTDILVYRGTNAPPRENRDLDDFVPEVTQETDSYLEKALSYVQMKSDDQDANLSIGLKDIPSHEEVAADSLMSNDLEADLMPSPSLAIQHGYDRDSSEDDLERPNEIQDYNDSDDDSLELDLDEPTRGKTPVRDILGQMAETVTSSVVGSGLVSSASSMVGSLWAHQAPQQLQVEPDLDDFAFVSDDEDELSLEQNY